MADTVGQESLVTIDLVTRRDPAVVLEEARKAAIAIKSVIDAKPDKVMMNGQTYLEFEDWQTLGRFYGLSVEIEGTKPVEFGGVHGWEASAVVKMVATGETISRAEAMCLNDEEKWRARPKYEWQYVLKDGSTQADDPGREHIVWEERRDGKGKAPKKKKVLVGEEAVPMFQLRSMAQTRAGAKAFRNVLSWVVVLAGYKPTPAEELDGMGAERVANTPAPADATAENGGAGVTPAGAVRVIQTKSGTDGALDVILHTGEILHVRTALKKLCGDITALDKEQPVTFTVSNGWITKVVYVPMTVPPVELKGNEIDFGGGEQPPVF